MKTMFKAALAVSTLIAGVAATSAAGAQAVSGIVTVDVHRIYAECNACKAAQTQLQAQGTQLRAFGEQLAGPLRTQEQALEAQQKALNGKAPDAAFQQRVQAFQTQQQTANTQFQQRQEALQRNQQYVLSQINAKLGPIVTSVMNAHHAGVAVDLNQTLSAAPGLDVTNDVLTQLNAQLPSVSVTAPSAPAGTSADGR